MNYNRVSHNLDAVRSDGVPFLANNDGAPSTFGVALASGTTYYFPLGGDRAPMPRDTALIAAHLLWDNAIIITSIAIEETNFPSVSPSEMATGIVDVSDFDATGGYWVPHNPSTGFIPVTAGTFNAATFSVSVAGGTAGGCIITRTDIGTRRARVKVVVGGTGGKIRCAVHGKLGS